MPDAYAIVPRAAETVRLRLDLQPLPMPILGNPATPPKPPAAWPISDVGCVVTLGGDGTNRVVAKGMRRRPAGRDLDRHQQRLSAHDRRHDRRARGRSRRHRPGASRDAVVRRRPRLDVLLDGEERDIALIDVVTSSHGWVGARALWDPAHLREVVLSRVAPAEIGICGLGGILFPEVTGTAQGVYARIGDGGAEHIVPLAPGLIARMTVAAASLVAPGEIVELDAAPCTVSLDGEREWEILKPGRRLAVRFTPDGPFVVDVESAIRAGAKAGAFRAGRPNSARLA